MINLQGNLEKTNNKYFAINGKGFFIVQDAADKKTFSRDGSFTKKIANFTNKSGQKLLGCNLIENKECSIDKLVPISLKELKNIKIATSNIKFSFNLNPDTKTNNKDQIIPFYPKEQNTQAELGDSVIINYEGTINGEAFTGSNGKKYQLTLGSNVFFPGFEEQLIGKKFNENFDINIHFPENYQASPLSGKNVLFKTKILKIFKENEVSTLNDTLLISYEGRLLDGTLFDGGSANAHYLKLGSGDFIPGFEEQLINKQIGEEIEVKVKFPTIYHSKELADQEAIFKTKIFKILSERENEAAEFGDVVKINYTAFIDNQINKDESSLLRHIKLGANEVIPGFDEELIGKNINDEIDISTTYPSNYKPSPLAGQDTIFKTEIIKIIGNKIQPSSSIIESDLERVHSQTFSIIDSLGKEHDIVMSFAKLYPNKWAVEIYPENLNEITSKFVTNKIISYGILEFNHNGSLKAISDSLKSGYVLWNNGAENKLELDFGPIFTIEKISVFDKEIFTQGATTQIQAGYSGNINDFGINTIKNDPNVIIKNNIITGSIQNYRINKNGVLYGIFKNSEIELFKIPLSSGKDLNIINNEETSILEGYLEQNPAKSSDLNEDASFIKRFTKKEDISEPISSQENGVLTLKTNKGYLPIACPNKKEYAYINSFKSFFKEKLEDGNKCKLVAKNLETNKLEPIELDNTQYLITPTTEIILGAHNFSTNTRIDPTFDPKNSLHNLTKEKDNLKSHHNPLVATVIDSLGQTHLIKIGFIRNKISKEAEDKIFDHWVVEIFSKGREKNENKQITHGTLKFDTKTGNLIAAEPKYIDVDWENGAMPSKIKLNWGKIGNNNNILTDIKLVNNSTNKFLKFPTSNGAPPVKISNLSIEDSKLYVHYGDFKKPRYQLEAYSFEDESELILYQGEDYFYPIPELTGDIEILDDAEFSLSYN